MDRITVRYNIPAMKTAISFRTFFMEANKDRNQVPFFVIAAVIGLISHSFLQLVAPKVKVNIGKQVLRNWLTTPFAHHGRSIGGPNGGTSQ